MIAYLNMYKQPKAMLFGQEIAYKLILGSFSTLNAELYTKLFF